MRDDGTYDDSEAEQIIDSVLIPAPLGNYDGGFDRYDNSIVYFFSFFGLVAIGVAAYRVGRHRPHATCGLAVAIVATLVGITVTAAAVSQV